VTPREVRPWWLAVALFAATLALYAPAARFGFVEFDDPAYVRDNPHLAHGLDAPTLAWAFASTDYQYNWHPLTWVSHALDVALFGLDPGAMHLENAVLHALAAALLFLAFQRLSARPWPSALAAALFALHPVRVESVAWIAQRKDVLAGVLFAATLWAWAGHARRPGAARLVGVAALLAAGLLAKPTLVTLPFVLLLLDAWPLGRLSRASAAGLVREKLPLLALCAAGAAMTLVAQRAGGAIRASLPLTARIENALCAYAGYLGDFVAPHDLALLYPHPALVDPAGTRVLAALGAALLLGGLLFLAFRARRRAPELLVGLLWFLGVLVPMIGLVQVGNQARADRYAYLAQIGLELALAFRLAALWSTAPRLRPLVVGGSVALLAALALLSSRQLALWRDSRVLFEHALAVTERNFVIENNLGLVLANEGALAPALAHFEAAAAARPGFYEAELNAGKAHYGLEALAAARAAFERALAVRPASGEARLCLAQTLYRLGTPVDADAELARALECEPALVDDPRARRLGAALAQALGGSDG